MPFYICKCGEEIPARGQDFIVCHACRCCWPEPDLTLGQTKGEEMSNFFRFEKFNYISPFGRIGVRVSHVNGDITSKLGTLQMDHDVWPLFKLLIRANAAFFSPGKGPEVVVVEKTERG